MVGLYVMSNNDLFLDLGMKCSHEKIKLQEKLP